MKLPDFKNSGLSKIRTDIGAELDKNYDNYIDWSEIHIDENLLNLRTKGEFIINDSSDIGVGEDNTLEYLGDKIVVYIRDWGKFYYDTKGSLPKIHFYNCKTIVGMKEKNIFDSKYVGATTTTGELKVNLVDRSKSIIEKDVLFELGICSNCLKEAKEDMLIDNSIINNFSLKNYFDYYNSKVDKPTGNRLFNIENKYTDDFTNIISKRAKEKVNYICQGCGKNCINDKHNLHTHHLNHIKGDNDTSNLKVVCYNCHAKYHDHM